LFGAVNIRKPRAREYALQLRTWAGVEPESVDLAEQQESAANPSDAQIHYGICQL
jgi:hypothetical protein